MQKRSWILLGVCGLILFVLGIAYLNSQNASETLTQEQATHMLDTMKSAVEHKSVSTLMGFIAPSSDTRIANLNPDQLRGLLARAFHQAGPFQANFSNETFQSNGADATLDFDLAVTQKLDGGVGNDYRGHITLHYQRVAVPHLFGLFHSKEWRIVRAESSGPDPTSFGDY